MGRNLRKIDFEKGWNRFKSSPGHFQEQEDQRKQVEKNQQNQDETFVGEEVSVIPSVKPGDVYQIYNV